VNKGDRFAQLDSDLGSGVGGKRWINRNKNNKVYLKKLMSG